MTTQTGQQTQSTSGKQGESSGGGGGGETYTCKAGDTLISIAYDKGFRNWPTIWEHPSNAKLREERDPQVLAEGDKVFIPEKKPREFQLKTGERHTFTLKALGADFRTEVRDSYGKPLCDCKYTLEIKGTDFEPMKLSGFTDETGVIELKIHPKAEDGTLKVWMSEDEVLTWTLHLGKLAPVSTTKGVKARLTNLGFTCGKIDDEETEEYKTALKQFQVVYKLPMTGQADDATRQKLLYVHDQR